MRALQRFAILACSLFVLTGGAASAQEKGNASPDEMMKEWAKWANPAEAHKTLQKLVGTWDAGMKMWMDPAAPPAEYKGAAVYTSELGGRWIRERFTGEFMGMPFEGWGMFGYDNFRQEYVSTWIDNMSTSMMVARGQWDGNQLVQSGRMDEPLTGEKDKLFRQVHRWIDDDHFVFEMYDNIPGKGEVKVMEIAHSRAK